MVGLLTFIRGAETDPNLVALALGRYIYICRVTIFISLPFLPLSFLPLSSDSDLTTLGLHLNSPE